jgi:hydroxymethylbilane synthase
MSSHAKLRLGTRGSDLARTQSGTVAEALRKLGFDVELTIIRTAGDRAAGVPFASIGPQGVFVREIEQALVAGDVDLAVHSFKDLPTRSPPALTIAAVPARVDPADLLLAHPDALSSAGDEWLPLAAGARVGTASARRRVWLAHYRPDLEVEALRGNVPTRIAKLKARQCDAILLAAAGVERLRANGRLASELDGVEIRRLDPERFVPAPAQGALAVQCRRADDRLIEALDALDHGPSRTQVAAERAALALAEGGCDIAFGAYCRSVGEDCELLAMYEYEGRVRTARARGRDSKTLGAAVWEQLSGAAP